MEALRMIKKPTNRKITITLPESFGDEPVEVIVLSTGKKRKTRSKFNPEKYYGLGQSSLSVEEIDRQLREMRDEWDRDV